MESNTVITTSQYITSSTVAYGGYFTTAPKNFGTVGAVTFIQSVLRGTQDAFAAVYNSTFGLSNILTFSGNDGSRGEQVIDIALSPVGGSHIIVVVQLGDFAGNLEIGYVNNTIQEFFIRYVLPVCKLHPTIN